MSNKIQSNTNLDIKEQQQQGGRGLFGGLPWCKKVSLMKADGAEADKGGPQELLFCRIGPTTSMTILNKSGKA
jgi:hypothetical protein